MKIKTYHSWLLLLALSCLINCRKNESKPVEKPVASQPSADSIAAPTAIDTPAQTETVQSEEGIPSDFDSAGIQTEIDSILRARDTLVSLDTVRGIFDSVFSDSVYRVIQYYAPGYSSHITDSVFIDRARKVTRKAYAHVLAYQRGFSLNHFKREARPLLIDTSDLKGTGLGKGLASPGPSDYLREGEFFFIGGSPLILNNVYDLEQMPRDGQGQVSVDYSVDRAVNTNKLLASILPAIVGKVRVDFGRGSVKYDVGPLEIHGVGTLIHRFGNPVPVYFLTKKGAIRGSLNSVDVKMGKDYVCGTSEYPEAKFTSNLSPDEKILGIYIPYDGKPPASCVLKRGKNSWTLDLNGDQIPDLGCVMKPFLGCMDDTLYAMSWFVNVNGEWKLLDSGSQADCT